MTKAEIASFKQLLYDKQGRILVIHLVLKKEERKCERLSSETRDSAEGA